MEKDYYECLLCSKKVDSFEGEICLCYSCKTNQFKIETSINDGYDMGNPSINKITEKIYLGNYEYQRSCKNELLQLGITHILIAAKNLDQCHPNQFKYMQIDLNDDEEEDILCFIYDSIEFINKSDKIFIHCQAGRSRSAAIVIAFLMVSNTWSYTKAYNFVKEIRPIIDPNESYVKQLKKFETSIL